MTRSRKPPSLSKRLRAAERRIEVLEEQLRVSEDREEAGRRLYAAAVRGRNLLRESVFGPNLERAVFSLVLQTESNIVGDPVLYRLTGDELVVHGCLAEPIAAPLHATATVPRDLARRLPSGRLEEHVAQLLVNAARELGSQLFGRSMDRAMATARARSGGSVEEGAAR